MERMNETTNERTERIEKAKKRILNTLTSKIEEIKSETLSELWVNKNPMSASDMKIKLDAGKNRVKRIEEMITLVEGDITTETTQEYIEKINEYNLMIDAASIIEAPTQD